MKQIYNALGVDPASKRELDEIVDLKMYLLNYDIKNPGARILLVEDGPKNHNEIVNAVRNIDHCIVICKSLNTFFLKKRNKNHMVEIFGDDEEERVARIIRNEGLTREDSRLDYRGKMTDVLNKLQNMAGDFDNRGIFSSYYLKKYLFKEFPPSTDIVSGLGQGGGAERLLEVLGWKLKNGVYQDKTVSVTITNQRDFGLGTGEVSPGMSAHAKLKKSMWSILTNGKRWRLYSKNVSATSMNYLEVELNDKVSAKYLAILFGASSYSGKKTIIQTIYDESQVKATKARDDLSYDLVEPKGIFLDIVKGVINPNKKVYYSDAVRSAARDTAMKIMYRIWFVAYAESRKLLPVNEKKYNPISLQMIHRKLDTYTNKGDECWNDLLKLFEHISRGSKAHNLPQYNGDLFAKKTEIDDISISNKYIVPALRGLLEKDGKAIDYADFGVRHLGNVFENLMSFSVRQARNDMNLVEEKGVFKEVKSKIKGALSFEKHELYLAAKGGIADRKMSASYYTNEEMVKFLVSKGLEPILKEREAKLGSDVRRYVEHNSNENKRICMDRLTDIQILDPAMGSGHFLVEALNQTTSWCNEMLYKYPEHPMMMRIKDDRAEVMGEQRRKGIMINESLLTQDVLLKRHIMKRCIFGVDIQPMAVELARLSLWLDSFAMGMPLTYMGHHLRCGDSTMGLFNEDFQKMEGSGQLIISPEPDSIITMQKITGRSDITVSEARSSEKDFEEYKKLTEEKRAALDVLASSKIDKKFFGKTPETGKKSYIEVIARNKGNPDKVSRVAELKERHNFFHWEHEFGDAFTDARRGFDLIVGNPPWEKIKPSDDEFFGKYDPTFKKLSPKRKKTERKKELLKDNTISEEYDVYKKTIDEKSMYYRKPVDKKSKNDDNNNKSDDNDNGEQDTKTDTGDKDLWKIILDRSLNLLTNGGMLSMVIPGQLLTGVGVSKLRKKVLENDIRSLYVFENKYGIFPIHRSWLITCLTMRNGKGDDKFPVAFYLHHLKSLENHEHEKEKFGIHSQSKNLKSPGHIIPALVGIELALFHKLETNPPLGFKTSDGWSVALNTGLHRTNDSDLFKNKGLLLHEGKTMQQFMDDWSIPEFRVNQKEGMIRMEDKDVFKKKCKEIHDSCRLVFRDVTNSKATRTSLATLLPPHTFHANSITTIIPYHENEVLLDDTYDEHVSYLCGILNSMVFDFAARPRVDLHLTAIVKYVPVPPPAYKTDIARLAGKLLVGKKEFAGLAQSFGIDNKAPTFRQRMEYEAELNAIVADAYGLTEKEYEAAINSFTLFERNESLTTAKEMIWDDNSIKRYQGEMAARSMEIFKKLKKKEADAK